MYRLTINQCSSTCVCKFTLRRQSEGRVSTITLKEMNTLTTLKCQNESKLTQIILNSVC